MLLLAPAWGSYDAQVAIADGRPVHVAPGSDGSCAPDLGAIRAAVDPRTQGIVLNTPSNPSGWESALPEIVIQNDLWLISGETYARLVFKGARHASPAAHSPEMLERPARSRRRAVPDRRRRC